MQIANHDEEKLPCMCQLVVELPAVDKSIDFDYFPWCFVYHLLRKDVADVVSEVANCFHLVHLTEKKTTTMNVWAKI